LDVIAALNPDMKKLKLSIVNPTFTAHEINVSFSGAAPRQGCIIIQIRAPAIGAANRAGLPPRITVVTS
jgi:hypothetical protein